MTLPAVTNLRDPLADLGRIGLSTGSVYLVQGVPQVFARVFPKPAEGESETWLYVPREHLETFPDHVADHPARPTNDTFAGGVVTIDDIPMHPIIVDGAVHAFVGVPNNQKQWAPDILAAILERIVLHDALLDRTGNPMVEELLQRIFSRDTSPDRFLSGVLNLLTEQIPGGLAVTYNETDGLYRLRLAVGDIALWDKLDGALTHATASGWNEAIERECPFVPVGFLPEYPVLLQDPPTFVFVHHGIEAQQSRSIIAMPVPGNLTPLQARHLTEIGRILSHLHERQFGVTDDFLTIAGMSRRVAAGARTFDDVLLEAFALIARRVDLTRLVYVDPSGNSRSVVRRMHADPVVTRDQTVPIAPSSLSAAARGHYLMPNLTYGDTLSEDEAKRYYLSNVKSELCLSVRSGRTERAYIAVGSSTEGDHLMRIERFLDTVAVFVDLCREAAEGRDVILSSPENTDDRPNRAAARIETMRKMTDGYFHDIIDRLSYVLGQAELLGSDPYDPAGHELDDKTPTRIVSSIEAVVSAMEHVRALIDDADDTMNQPMRASHLLNDLPSCLEGYSHRLQDTKNIALRIVPARSVRTNLELTRGEMYDYVYPVLLAIMDEAICSGKITVRATTINNLDALAIESDAEIVAHTSLPAIIRTWAGLPDEEEDADGATLIVDDFTWYFDTLPDTRHRAWLVRSAAAGAPLTPPNARVRDRKS